MIILKNIKLPKITGIALWPLILLKPKVPSKTIINHERIHIRQQAEMLVLPFYIWYFIEWSLRFLATKNFDLAYRSISFEKEAYIHEKNLEYLKTRKFWSFIKYL